jgi:hypothetical protein
MNPEEAKKIRISAHWNAGRTEWGKRGVDNFLIGASWSNWGGFNRERLTHIYLGLWVVTITTPTKGGKTRRDITS